MDPFAIPPLAAILDAAYTALMWIAATLEPITGAASASIAIVLVTLVVRAGLIPVGIAQADAERARAHLAPRLRALQRRYGNDRERLRRETARLYADTGASPLAGCLPMLVQTPVVAVIYALFLRTTIAGHTNALLSQHLFGVPLGTSLIGAVAHGMAGWPVIAVLGTILVLMMVVAEATRRTSVPGRDAASETSSASQVASRLAGLLHYASAVAAMFVPLAASLYLLVTVTWTLGQRLILRRSPLQTT